MLKRINRATIVCGIVIAIIILLTESLITNSFHFQFVSAFILGLFTGLLNLFISDKAIEKVQYNLVRNPKAYLPSINILKLLIYALAFVFTALYIEPFAVFTCFFGIMLNKIVIYLLYLVVDKIQDKKRTVDDLHISEVIKQKLKDNGFMKVLDITNVNRQRLMQFLTLNETEIVIRSLKEYELFIKGELEAIIEDDDAHV